MIAWKGYIFKAMLVKLEKYQNGIKVSQCGVDAKIFHDLWGSENSLRPEYELYVSQGNVPEYIKSESIEDIS